MAITWLETDIVYSSSPKFKRCVGYEETGRNATSVTYKIYLKLKVEGSSSSFFGYGINWSVDGGSTMKIKDASPRWYGNEGYREFSTTITKSATASGGSTSFSVKITGVGASAPNLSKSYTAKVSTWNTAPTWSSSARLRVRENDANGYLVAEDRAGTENSFKAREDVSKYYVYWDSASDNENNISRYELFTQINDGAWSLIYSGSNRNYTHTVGAGNQGYKYDYYVVAVDSYGEKSPSLDTRQFQKNALTGANLTISNGIWYDTTSMTLTWSGASNTSGNTSFTYSISSSGLTIYNKEKLTASGGTIKILKSGTSTDPYILFEDVKKYVASSSTKTGQFNISLTTKNAYGSTVTKTATALIDVRTNPKAPTTVSIGGKVSTSLGNYLIPSRSNAVVSWSGASDYLGGSLTYDVYYKVGSGSEVLATSGVSSTSASIKLPTPTSATTVAFRVVAKTTYGNSSSSSTVSDTTHFYNPPTVSISGYNRTVSNATLTITNAVNSSIPNIAFKKQSYTGNGTTANYTGAKYTATINGLNESSAFTFTATVNDNTGLSSDVSASFKVTPATPKLSVREKGVGVNCVNTTDKALAIVGGVDVQGDFLFNGNHITTGRLLGSRKITVGGDANKYYPLLIGSNNSTGFPWISFSVSRNYNWKAPDTWNNATHKGGLTLGFKWSGDTSWGGNDKSFVIEEFDETYCKMVAGMQLSTMGIVIWLRGGGAEYMLSNEYGMLFTYKIYYEAFSDGAGNSYGVRGYNADTVKNEIYQFFPIRAKGREMHTGSLRADNDTLIGSWSSTSAGIRTSRNILFNSGKQRNVLGANVYFDGSNDVHYDKNAGASQLVLDANNYMKFRWSNKGESSYGIAQWSSYYDVLTTYEGQQAFYSRGNVGDGDNWNNFVNTGAYAVVCPNSATNHPPNSYYYGMLLVFNNSNVVAQMYLPHNGGHFMQYRVRWSSGNWTNWANVGWSQFSLNGLNETLVSNLPATLEGEVEGEEEAPAKKGSVEDLVSVINYLDNRVRELENRIKELEKARE